MDNITINSSWSLVKTDWCLICCSAYSKLKNYNSSTTTSSSNSHYDSNWLMKATEKIFQYLLIPKEHLVNVKKKKSLLSFCPNCKAIVDQIIKLQKKVEILELKIRWKVESLGKIAIDTPAFTRTSESDQKQVAEVWTTFKAPVTQNFLQGLLPNPSVNLGKIVNKDEISSKFQNAKNSNSKTNSKNDKTETVVQAFSDDGSSDCIILDEDLKSETDGNMSDVRVEENIVSKKFIRTEEDPDSDDDLFEIFDPPVMSINTIANRKYTKSDKSNQQANTQVDFNSVATNLLQNVHANATKNAHKTDLSNENVTVKSKTFLGHQIVNEDIQESFSTDAEVIHVRNKKAFSGKLQSKGKKSESGIGTNCKKRLRPNPTTVQKGHNTGQPDSNPTSPKRQMLNMPTGHGIVKPPLKRKSGRKPFFTTRECLKCTKCDFQKKITSLNGKKLPLLRMSVADHYSRKHNIVEPKITHGKYCYKCLLCNFSYSYHSHTHSPSFYRKRRLSLHLMEMHDGAFERQSESNSQSHEMSTKVASTSSIANMLVKDLGDTKKKLEVLIEGRDCIKCTKCDFSAKKNPSSSNIQNLPSKLRQRVADHYIRCHNHIRRTDITKTSDGRDSYKCTKCNYSVVIQTDTANSHKYYRRKLALHYMRVHDAIENQTHFEIHEISPTESQTLESTNNSQDPNKELEELIKGRDYIKCTKCDYYVQKSSTKTPKGNCPSRLRQRVADHYSNHHNPVNPNIITKTIDGKDCYQCTKCTFSVVFQSNTPQTRKHFLSKLSTHYMELHDVFESQHKSTACTEGVDYFLCPILNCTFVTFIKRAESQKQQLFNATEARLTVVEHYRTSKMHHKECMDILPPMTNPPLKLEGVGVSFYKCTKCDFKSFIREWENYTTNAVDPGERARNALNVHYLLEHIFPWEIFPGMFKYGCYREKSVLKCPYSDCDYFTKIQYDLEGRNKEECELEASQCFTEHALNHNFNSICFTNDDNQFPDQSVEEPLKADNFINHGEFIKLSEECGRQDSITFQSLDRGTNSQFNDVVYEEVTIKNEAWPEDYEEVEEVNPMVFDSQEKESNNSEIILFG